MSAVKIIRVMGTSEDSWEAAAEEAVARAGRTIDDISGVKIHGWTANVEDGEISQYKTLVELAFPVRENL